MNPLERLIAQRYTAHLAAVEEACEAALQGGEHGVRVRWDHEQTVAVVDPTVPYGHVYDMPYGDMEDR